MFLLKENNRKSQKKTSGPLPVYDVKIVAGKKVMTLSDGLKEASESFSRKEPEEEEEKPEVNPITSRHCNSFLQRIFFLGLLSLFQMRCMISISEK